MKLLKSIILLSLAFFLINAVNAAPKQSPQSQNAQQRKQTEDRNLKLFNQAVGIRLASAQILHDNQPPLLRVVYTIENRGKKRDIKSLVWVGAFAYDNQVFFAQDIPVTLNKPLQPGKKIDITISIPFDKISPEAQAIFLQQAGKVQSIHGARNVTFTNGAKIDVK